MKKIVMLCITTMILSLVGCGKVTATDTAVAEEKNTDVQDKVVIGKVTAIAGNELTVAAGEMKLAEEGIKPEEKPPENLKPDGEAPKDMKTKDKATENVKPEKLFNEDGETIQLTLSENIAIEVETNGMTEKGSVTDIKEGSLISIVYDTKGEVTTVQVMGEHGLPKPPTGK